MKKDVNGTAALYWYNGADIILETDGGTGVETARYTHGPGIDNPLKVRSSGESYFLHEDALGSIAFLTDSKEKKKNNYDYDAFGNISYQSGTIHNPFLYTGREWDEEIGLYYYRARHYDPAAGRFLQGDPLGPVDGTNLYAYVQNNPVNWIDPWGLESNYWRPVPGQPGWEVSRDKQHGPWDYRHKHYGKKGKEYGRKVNSVTGEQRKHGKKGIDADVPQDIVDASQSRSSGIPEAAIPHPIYPGAIVSPVTGIPTPEIPPFRVAIPRLVCP